MGQPLTSAWPTIYIRLSRSESTTRRIANRGGLPLWRRRRSIAPNCWVSRTAEGAWLHYSLSPRGEEQQQQQLSNVGNWLKCTVVAWSDREKNEINIWKRKKVNGINWDTVVMVDPRGACSRPWLFSLVYLCLLLFFWSFWCTRLFRRWLKLKL